MKTMFALALISVVSTAGFSAEYADANLYTCSAPNLDVSLSSSSLLGRPQLNLSGNQVEGAKFSATTLVSTTMGYQAAVSVSNINDATIDYTLIVPQVKTEELKEYPVSGLLIKTMAGTLVSPHQRPGPVQTNTVTRLDCVAQTVKF